MREGTALYNICMRSMYEHGWALSEQTGKWTKRLPEELFNGAVQAYLYGELTDRYNILIDAWTTENGVRHSWDTWDLHSMCIPAGEVADMFYKQALYTMPEK